MRLRSTILWPAGLALAAALVPAPARATDGHFLHGVGAVNSALGGAGVATGHSILGAFFVNPAALALFRGTHSELAMELFKPDRTVESAVGTFRGSTRSNSEFVAIPAFGWTTSFRDDRVVVGLGGLGIGGFGVRYAADATNPILMPRPNGFGQVYSNFSLLKVAPSVAWSVTPKLMFGVALNVDWASLAVDPMPAAAPAADPGPDGTPFTQDDRAYYSGAAHADGAFGIGAQLGLLYKANEHVALGVSYASPQVFQDFEFDAVFENPNLPSYNTPRTFSFAMDVPAVYAAGISVSPTSAFNVAADVKYITYASTNGFREEGFNQDGSVKGFGWENIAVLALGAQWKANDGLTLRGGYNYSGNPVPDEQSMFNLPAPAIVQHHLTAGAGFRVRDGLQLNVAAYKAFENSITGSILRPNGPVPGSSVSSSMSETSFLIGFAFSPPSSR
jgi:long-chain fatty acid transport protein